MNESGAKTHLESCRELYLTQQADKRDLGAKSMGAAAISIALWGTALAFMAAERLAPVQATLIEFSGIIVALLLGLVLYFLGPKRIIGHPFNLNASETLVSEMGHNLNSAAFTMTLAHFYKKAIETNSRVLKKRLFLVRAATIAVVLQTLLLTAAALASSLPMHIGTPP